MSKVVSKAKKVNKLIMIQVTKNLMINLSVKKNHLQMIKNLKNYNKKQKNKIQSIQTSKKTMSFFQYIYQKKS